MRDDFNYGYILPPYVRTIYRIAPFILLPIIIPFLFHLWIEGLRQLTESYTVLVFAFILTLTFVIFVVNYLKTGKYYTMQYCCSEKILLNTYDGFWLFIIPQQEYSHLKVICNFYFGKGKKQEVYYIFYKNEQEIPQSLEIEGVPGLIELLNQKYLIIPATAKKTGDGSLS